MTGFPPHLRQLIRLREVDRLLYHRSEAARYAVLERQVKHLKKLHVYAARIANKQMMIDLKARGTESQRL